MHLVADRHGSRPEHLVIQLLLLQIRQLLLQLVVVECAVGDCALGQGFGDLFADGVLFSQVLPASNNN